MSTLHRRRDPGRDRPFPATGHAPRPGHRPAPVAAAVLCALLAGCSADSPSSSSPDGLNADDSDAGATGSPGVPTADTGNALGVVPGGAIEPVIVSYTALAPNGPSDGAAAAQVELEAASPAPSTGGGAGAGTPAAPDPEEPIAPPPRPAAPESPESGPEATPEGPEGPDPQASNPQEPETGAANPGGGGTGPAAAPTVARAPVIGAERGDVEKILTDLEVSSSQLMVQQTPVDTRDGFVYTANIEHGPSGGGSPSNLVTDLRTVVRQGVQDENGEWRWTSTLVEDRTAHDQWHTAPSIAADADGFVHVAYNMHNMPWQYKRSDAPHDIGAFTFRGQPMSQAEIDRSRFENKTNFPTLGTAEIPGNQVTYPAFFKNGVGDLYLTYRFAAKPKRSFPQRQMSTGVARYDLGSRTWSPIGAEIATDAADATPADGAPARPTAFLSEQGWTSYKANLMFDGRDNAWISAFWRNGIAGAELTRPCLFGLGGDGTATAPDGSAAALPITTSACGNMGRPDYEEFWSVGGTAMDASGTPYVVLSPKSGGRQIASLDRATGAWTSEDSPYAATELFVDGRDTLWAVANGPNVLKRDAGSSTWDLVYSEGSRLNCFPQASLNEDRSIAYIHTHSCDEKRVTVYALRLE